MLTYMTTLQQRVATIESNRKYSTNLRDIYVTIILYTYKRLDNRNLIFEKTCPLL